MLKSKSFIYLSHKNFTKEQFKEAVRSDSSYIANDNLTSLQNVTEKNLNKFASIKKIVLPHMESQAKKLS